MDRLYEIYSEPGITEYMEGLYDDIEEEREFTREYIRHMYGFYEYGIWTVCLKDGTVIGRAGICHREINGEMELEVGYVIDKMYQNKGYGTEAVRAAVEYAETRLEVSHLNAFIRKGNISSVKLVEKLDFKYLMETVLDGFDYVIYRRENASV